MESISKELHVSHSLLVWVFFVCCLILEGTISSIPLVLLFLLVLYVLFKKSWVFFVAFGTGIVLDILYLQSLGATSLFFIFFLLVIVLYEKKFEITTIPFVLYASFLGSGLFLWVFGYEHVFLQALFSSVLGVVLFGGVRYLCTRKLL